MRIVTKEVKSINFADVEYGEVFYDLYDSEEYYMKVLDCSDGEETYNAVLLVGGGLVSFDSYESVVVKNAYLTVED